MCVIQGIDGSKAWFAKMHLAKLRYTISNLINFTHIKGHTQ